MLWLLELKERNLLTLRILLVLLRLNKMFKLPNKNKAVSYLKRIIWKEKQIHRKPGQI